MSSMPEASSRAHTEAAPTTTPQGRVVFVAGSGRSGTSTLSGALQQLGLYVPRPEVVADPTNPRGFGEPQWAVDFHNRLLKRVHVQVSDARPQAWFDTGKLSLRGHVRDELTDWLSEQAQQADELVIKDPRLSWFLGLWRVGAIRCGLTPTFATMLRPPMEVVGSKQKAYGNRIGDIHGMAAWVNMMLHTEQATRGSARVFVRYHDLLEDWTTSVFRAGEVLGLAGVQNAPGEAIRRVHGFIDPSLRSVQASWDDFEGPAPLRRIAEATWEQLNKLPEPDGDTADVQSALDELRAEYTQMYADAETMAHSSVIAASRRGAGRASKAMRRSRRPASPAKEPPAPAPEPAPAPHAETPAERAMARLPHGARALVPARLRRRVRHALARGANRV